MPEFSTADWYAMSDYSISHEIGIALRNLRLQQDLTQKQLGENAGLSRSAISEMENGKTATSLLTIIQVLRALQKLNLLDDLQNSIHLQITREAKSNRTIRSRATSTQYKKSKEETEWEWL